MNPTMSTGIILLVLFFALLGGLANAMLVWLNQKPRPPFDGGSFAASFIIALAAAAGIAEMFNYGSVTNTVLACLAAFLTGMGTNGAVSGIAGTVIKRLVSGPPIQGVHGEEAVPPTKRQFIPGNFYRRI